MGEPIFSNEFGSVSDNKITINYKSGMTSVSKDAIKSISVYRKRNFFFVVIGWITFLLAVAMILVDTVPLTPINTIIIIVIGVLGLLIAIAHSLGHHEISFNTSGEKLKPLKIEMSKTKAGQDYYKAVERVIFDSVKD